MTPLVLLVIAVFAPFFSAAAPAMPRHSRAAPPVAELAQVWGGYCQTQFGICPLVDPQGNPIQAPVGSICFCGQDPGQVRQ